MTINSGVKGTLAKLLATEDIVVEHRKCQTAQFDVERRVLTLPIWDIHKRSRRCSYREVDEEKVSRSS